MSTGDGGQWKWDVSIYDRPEWVARFRGRGRLVSPDGQRLYLRFEELERASYYGDYFMGRHRDTWVCSPDGGRSWQAIGADQAPNVDGVALPGTCGRRSPSPGGSCTRRRAGPTCGARAAPSTPSAIPRSSWPRCVT
jgi:hypothetical protein